MANAKTGDTIAATAGRAPESLPQPATVTNGDVARRAYDRYLVRDRDHGHDVDDWLQAECDLRAEYLEMPALRLKPEQVQRLGDVGCSVVGAETASTAQAPGDSAPVRDANPPKQ